MRPDIRERIARHNANNAERDHLETRRVSMAIKHLEWEEEFRQFKERLGYDLCLAADAIARRLERIRDEHMPSVDPYAEFDEEFCMAVKLLPYAKMYAEECEIECIKEKKS